MEKRKLSWDIIALLVFILTVLVFSIWVYFDGARYIFPPIGENKGATLGQVGDYFGGLLNPTLGLCSVILLMWGITSQREELRMTTKALNEQIKLTREEVSRGQIAETINYELEAIERKFLEKIALISIEYPLPETDEVTATKTTIKFDSLSTLLDECSEAYGYPNLELYKLLRDFDPTNKTPSDPNFWRFWSKVERVKHKLDFIVTAYLDHLNVCHVKTTNDKWFSKIHELMQNCQTIGIYDPDEDDENLRKMLNARNNKKYKVDESSN